jgi:hypothetical protein
MSPANRTLPVDQNQGRLFEVGVQPLEIRVPSDFFQELESPDSAGG